jgi:hypothetical protein
MKDKLNANEKAVAIKALHLFNQFGKGNYSPIKEEIAKGNYSTDIKNETIGRIDELEIIFHNTIGDIKLHSSFAYAKLAEKIIECKVDGFKNMQLSEHEIKVLSESSSLYTKIGLGKLDYLRDQLIKQFNNPEDKSKQSGFSRVSQGFDEISKVLNNTMGINHKDLHDDYKSSNKVSKISEEIAGLLGKDRMLDSLADHNPIKLKGVVKKLSYKG